MQRNSKPMIQQLQVSQMMTAPEQQGIKCFLCGGPHPLHSCPQMATITKDEKAKSALKRILEAQQLALHQLQEDAEAKTHPTDDYVSTNLEVNDDNYATPEEAEDEDFCSAG